MLTGCDSDKDYFGTTGTYILKLGEDVFGTGHTGIFGGEDEAEPQSNTEAYRFDDYNVKEVADAPETEKKEYDFTGPENGGVTQTSKSNSAAESSGSNVPKGNSGTTNNKSNDNTSTVVVLSCGHIDGGDSKVELMSKMGYYYFARDVLKACYKSPTDSNDLLTGMSITNGSTALRNQLYKMLTGDKDDMASVYLETEVKSLYQKLVKYGVLTGKNGKFDASAISDSTPSNKACKQFYKKNGAKLDKLLAKLNKSFDDSSYGQIKTFLSGHTSSGSSEPTSSKYFKARCTSGGSYNGFSEYKINYETMKAVGAVLKKEGYKIVYEKTDVSSTKLSNGKALTNKNMSEMAASEGAAIHLNIHWDSSGGSKKGLHTYSPTKPYSDVGSLSKDVAKAMYDAGKSFFSDENTVSPGYTTLNWATVPTLIVECGYMTAKDYGQYYDSNAATRKKHMNSWAKDRKKVFVAAVEAAIDSDN